MMPNVLPRLLANAASCADRFLRKHFSNLMAMIVNHETSYACSVSLKGWQANSFFLESVDGEESPMNTQMILPVAIVQALNCNASL